MPPGRRPGKCRLTADCDLGHSLLAGCIPTIKSSSSKGAPVFKIIHAQFLAPGIKRFVIEAPRIARKQRPGQFVILRIYEEGERIPVTIENSDPERGTINIVVQSAGKTTHLLNSLETGDSILDVVGPLGQAVRDRELRDSGRGGRRRRDGDGLSHGGRAEAGREPRDFDRGRAQQRTRDSRDGDARGERCADDHHRRRQLRRQGIRHRQAYDN